ncbi:MAG: TonB-dependent receptor [Alphaproteobacteria bacterium]|nr:TonB-dependent receptor [Alphaproteobacteria bacterium]
MSSKRSAGTKQSLTFLNTLLLASAVSVPAFAQIETVVVTAEKRAQDVQTVPVAISVFNSEKRDAVGIQSIQDMTNFTPGLQYNTSTDRISLRGVGRMTNVLSADASVANYDDGLYETFAVAAGRSSLDLDRVEVLRGPQGTLYGRNSIAGALNEITRRPTDTLQSEFRLKYENYDHLTAEGYVSGPIIDDWQYKLYGSYERQSEGWAKSIIPGGKSEGNVIDEWYFDGQIQNKFTPNFEMWTKVQTAGWQNGHGGPGADSAGWTPSDAGTYEFGVAATGLNQGYGCTALPGGLYQTANTTVRAGSVQTPLPAATACSRPEVTSPRTTSNLISRTVTLPVYWSLNSQWTWHMPDFDVKYIGGGTYYHYRLTGMSSPGAGGAGVEAPISRYNISSLAGPASDRAISGLETFVYQEKNGFFSNELNFISTGNNALQWQAGVYQFFQHYNQPVYTQDPTQTEWNTPIFGGTCAGGVCAPATLFRRFDNRPSLKSMSLAAYFQLDYKLNEEWKFSGGLRYSWDRKYGQEQVRLLCYGVPACYAALELNNVVPATTPIPTVDLTQVGTVVASGTTGLPRGVTGLTTYNGAGFAVRNYDSRWDMFTGMAGVEWTPDEDTLVYAKYAKGYKSGGYNIGIFTVLSFTPWTDKEKVDSFEIGAKKTFGDWLVLDAAAFHYNYQNLQIPISIVQTSGGLAQSTTAFYNVPESVSQGVEIEAQVSPIENLSILANYSWLDAHITRGSAPDPADPTATGPGATPLYTDAQCAASYGNSTAALAFNSLNPAAICTRDVYTLGTAPAAGNGGIAGVAGGVGWQKPQNLKGNALPNAPRNKIAINVMYNWKNDWGTITPSVSYVWRDVQYGRFFERPWNAAPAWDQWDARVRFQAPDDKYEIILFGRNLADTIGYDGGALGYRLAGTIDSAVGGQTNFVQGGVAGTTPAPAGYGAVRGEGPFGTVTTYSPTPPRTYGIELHYKLF